MRRYTSRASTGFTLVEVTIALFLSVILLLGAFSSLSVANKARTLSAERDTAREACRARVEAISDLPFDSLLPLHGQQFAVPNPADVPAGVISQHMTLVSSVANELPGRVTVAATPESPTLLRVVVEVRWRSKDGSPNRLESSTFLARKD